MATIATKRRHADPSTAVPTAKFLQARITALSTTLIKRLENIFAVALDDNLNPNLNNDEGGVRLADNHRPPSFTETAVQQLQLDVETTALIRAAEEIMILTRTMKEIWLFGDLRTIQELNGGNEEVRVKDAQLMEDVKTVERGLQDFLKRYAGLLDSNQEQDSV